MAVLALTALSSTHDVGDEWVIGVGTFDDDGDPADATVTFTVTTAAGGTVTPPTVQDGTGVYFARYVLPTSGRFLAVAAVSGDVVGVQPFTAYAESSTDADGLPTLAAVKAYLGETSESDAQITAALAAEMAAQRRSCDVPAVYSEDLAEALKRRVARNLAARAVPIATFTSFEGGGTSSRVPQVDAEIARLEAPYRAWPIA